MPVKTPSDKKDCYAQWGNSGKRYYYPCENENAMNKAKQKTHLQSLVATGDAMKESEIWAKEQFEDHDKFFEITEQEKDTEKPGGSNKGKYKTGPFCGPSGGAPSGTYPVNTRKRAISALAYARNAPNPSGIKACVCRHWKGLPACQIKK